MLVCVNLIKDTEVRHNYLNNKDILKEIHTSKNTYCCYTKQEYHRYDIIIDMPDSDLETALKHASKRNIIKQAKEIRAARLSQETGTEVTVSVKVDEQPLLLVYVITLEPALTPTAIPVVEFIVATPAVADTQGLDPDAVAVP